MYIISELEKQEENILKLDKKELKKNVLYWYWLDATTGFAWFLGGQAWLDDHGINIMSNPGETLEGINFLSTDGETHIGDLSIRFDESILLSSESDLYFTALDGNILLQATADIDINGVLDVAAARFILPVKTDDPASPRDGEMWLRSDL